MGLEAVPKYRKMEFPVSGVEKDKYESVVEAERKIRPFKLGRSRGGSCPPRYSHLLDEGRGWMTKKAVN